jgi:hypothetical protein
MKRKSLWILVLVVLSLSATSALADGGIKYVYVDGVGDVPMYDDGRINAADMNAPVGIYVQKDTVLVLDEFGQQVWVDGMVTYEDRFSRYEFWGLMPGSDAAEKVMEVTYGEIMAAMESGLQFAKSAHGYTVHFDPASSAFSLIAPAYDYTFWWELAL